NAGLNVSVPLVIRTTAGLALGDRVYLDTSGTNEITVTASANAGYDLNNNGVIDPNEGTPLNFKANLGGLLNINIINARARITNPGLNIDIKDGGNGDNRLYFNEIGSLSSAGNYSSLVGGSFTGTIQSVVPMRNGATSPDVNPNPANLQSNEGW